LAHFLIFKKSVLKVERITCHLKKILFSLFFLHSLFISKPQAIIQRPQPHLALISLARLRACDFHQSFTTAAPRFLSSPLLLENPTIFSLQPKQFSLTVSRRHRQLLTCLSPNPLLTLFLPNPKLIPFSCRSSDYTF